MSRRVQIRCAPTQHCLSAAQDTRRAKAIYNAADLGCFSRASRLGIGRNGHTFDVSRDFGLREWARDRALAMLLGAAVFVLLFMHSVLTLLLAIPVAAVALWLTIRANRRRGVTLTKPIDQWGKE